MQDGLGFDIKEGFYKDANEMHYYHIIKTSEGFKKMEEKGKYSNLDEISASTLIRVPDHLVRLINSVQPEQSQPKCTELQNLPDPQYPRIGPRDQF